METRMDVRSNMDPTAALLMNLPLAGSSCDAVTILLTGNRRAIA